MTNLAQFATQCLVTLRVVIYLIAPKSQITVPFHSSNLIIVDHNGEPYTPMRPIVEGMGLDWKTQYRKLTSNKKRWNMVIMTTVALDNKQRESTCIPLRKLFGWLQTIQPNRVRVDIRDTVIEFQNKCDDVLWEYWNKEQLDPIMPVQPPKRMRFLMTMEHGHVVSTLPVPFESMVAAPCEIAERLKEPGSFSIEDYLEIAKVANEKVAELVKWKLG